MKIKITIEVSDEDLATRLINSLDHLRAFHFCEDDWDYKIETVNEVKS